MRPHSMTIPTREMHCRYGVGTFTFPSRALTRRYYLRDEVPVPPPPPPPFPPDHRQAGERWATIMVLVTALQK
jgi:hypothetical protein